MVCHIPHVNIVLGKWLKRHGLHGWVDELESADELTEPLGLRGITWAPEVTNDDMRRDVLTWYRQCTHCARGRWPPNKSHGKLQKVIVGEPLDIVAVDILSGLPTIPEGYR